MQQLRLTVNSLIIFESDIHANQNVMLMEGQHMNNKGQQRSSNVF